MGLWDIEKIPYVGREKGPQEGLAFHYYDADKVVAGKKMKDWLRFGVAWWHTFDQELVDPFGTGTAQRPWYGKYSNAEDEALAKVDYAFEFFLGAVRAYERAFDAHFAHGHVDEVERAAVDCGGCNDVVTVVADVEECEEVCRLAG